MNLRSLIRKYILKDGKPVVEPDLLKWARWIEANKYRHQFSFHLGEVWVTTIFLGVDHNFGDQGPPLVFETMVFGGKHHLHCQRYSTLAQAKRGHAKLVTLIKTELASEISVTE